MRGSNHDADVQPGNDTPQPQAVTAAEPTCSHGPFASRERKVAGVPEGLAKNGHREELMVFEFARGGKQRNRRRLHGTSAYAVARRRASELLCATLLRHAPTLLELVGAALIAYGLWLQWGPLAFLWAGVACFAASAAIEVSRRRDNRAEPGP